jgi:hypothetical protein
MNYSVFQISKGFKLVILSLVCFFIFLAILDGYENHEITYDNVERIDNDEFHILDITDEITRPSYRKVSKFERIEVLSVINALYSSIYTVEHLHYSKKAFFVINYIFKNYLITATIFTNAP